MLTVQPPAAAEAEALAAAGETGIAATAGLKCAPVHALLPPCVLVLAESACLVLLIQVNNS